MHNRYVPSILLAATPCLAALGDVINVPADYPTIQEAIDNSLNGDEIIVADGLYEGPGNEDIDFGGRSVTLRSANGADVCTIEVSPGLGIRAFHFHMSETSATRVEGFTIQEWSSAGPDFGGAVLIDGAGPTFVDCVIDGRARNGGGVAVINESTPTFERCDIHGYAYTEDMDGGNGGGVHVVSSVPTFLGCVFFGSAYAEGFDSPANGGNGGAVYTESSLATFVNCYFAGGYADHYGLGAGGNGGAMYNLLSDSSQVINCTLTGNEASGQGDGIYNDDTDLTVTNSILYQTFFFGGPDQEIVDGPGSASTVSHSDVQGGWSGAGVNNIDADPMLAFNFFFPSLFTVGVGHLSPCVDAGTNAAIPAGVDTDINGCARIVNGTVDMGAGEFAANVIEKGDNPFDVDVPFCTIAEALAEATFFGDGVVAAPELFAQETLLVLEKGVFLESTGDLVQPVDGLIVMGLVTTLRSGDGGMIELNGTVQVEFGSFAYLETPSLAVSATGTLAADPASVIEVVAPGGAVNAGQMTLYGVALAVEGGLTNDAGTITWYGDLLADVTNNGEVTFVADTQLVGDYTNNVTTTVQNGTLTIIGSLTNNGTLIGDVAGGSPEGPVASGDGVAVIGDYGCTLESSHLMPSPDHAVKVAGDYDVAINDTTRYDMVEAELRMIGLGETSQGLEVMSEDLGADGQGLNRSGPGRYPLGTLRIGPTPTVVNLVDARDNDNLGQASCEAIYVYELVVHEGATLNTLGCPVYYASAQIDGVVDDPANLIPVAVCPWDCQVSGPDGTVGINDFLDLLIQWNQVGTSCDLGLGADGAGIEELLDLLLHWGACP